MLSDRYDNPLTTSSIAARDAYVDGVDRLISADIGAEEAFHRATEADPNFALAYVGMARAAQISARIPEAREAIAKAKDAAERTSTREKSHVAAMSHLIAGRGADAYRAILEHTADHPRDALVVQPCAGVFGLIGFSGQPGREAEQLAFLNHLAPHYGDDWWFTCVHAFAQVEAGQIAPSIEKIERSLAGNPRNAHGAHIRAHIYYENGETGAGYHYIDGWRDDYDKRAPLHCHISWHTALWAMEEGDWDRAWEVYDTDVRPDGAWGPPINVLTDAASFLMRSEFAGGPPQSERWRQVSAYARKLFPEPGIAFADMHAALAHAMAGDGEALEKVIRDAKGPASDVVSKAGEAFRAFARQDWTATVAALNPIMSEHERLGGSRAQRDLLEFMYLCALLREGRDEEARRLIAMRRPKKVSSHPVTGL
jgi:tetratricopeptide (TPR) repeat protein